jgi:hypothetical protein
MNKFIPIITLLVACAPSEEKFEKKNIELTCDLTFECTDPETKEGLEALNLWFFGEDVEECKTILTDLANDDSDDTGSSDLIYDKEEAKECLTELEALTCDDINDGNISAPSCDDVYNQE